MSGLVAAVVVPHPPLLVPEVAGGAARELDGLRAACDRAVGWLVAQEPDVVVALAAGVPRTQGPGAVGTLAPYGLGGWTTGDRAVGADGWLGLGHTVCAWLLDRAGWRGGRRYDTVAGDAVDLPPGRVALLVGADGSARRDEHAPGYVDERAPGFDAGLARALAAGDASALTGVDLDLAAELWAHGAPALRSLGATVVAETQQGAATEAHLDHDAAPYGVGYLVSRWQVG